MSNSMAWKVTIIVTIIMYECPVIVLHSLQHMAIFTLDRGLH
jgi:hypothetical protein